MAFHDIIPASEFRAGGGTIEITEVNWVENIRRSPNNVDVAETRHHTGGSWTSRRWVIDYDEPAPQWKSYPDGEPASPALVQLFLSYVRQWK